MTKKTKLDQPLDTIEGTLVRRFHDFPFVFCKHLSFLGHLMKPLMLLLLFASHCLCAAKIKSHFLVHKMFCEKSVPSGVVIVMPVRVSGSSNTLSNASALNEIVLSLVR